MLTPYRQFKPAELYLGIDNPPPRLSEEEEGQSTDKINGFRATGCEFLDTFLNNLYIYGLHSGKFHANLLGIKSIALSYTIETLTGMRYIPFTAECTLLMADDLINRKPKDLVKMANRLGFTTYSGFFRFLKRYTKKSPTGIIRHRLNREEYEQLLLKWKLLEASAEKYP